MDMEREIEALKARVVTLENEVCELRGLIAAEEEAGRLRDEAALPRINWSTPEKREAQRRRDQIIGIRALLRPTVESLPRNQRAVLLADTPANVLRAVAAAPHTAAEARPIITEMADVAAKHALTWADLEMSDE